MHTILELTKPELLHNSSSPLTRKDLTILSMLYRHVSDIICEDNIHLTMTFVRQTIAAI